MNMSPSMRVLLVKLLQIAFFGTADRGRPARRGHRPLPASRFFSGAIGVGLGFGLQKVRVEPRVGLHHPRRQVDQAGRRHLARRHLRLDQLARRALRLDHHTRRARIPHSERGPHHQSGGQLGPIRTNSCGSTSVFRHRLHRRPPRRPPHRRRGGKVRRTGCFRNVLRSVTSPASATVRSTTS